MSATTPSKVDEFLPDWPKSRLSSDDTIDEPSTPVHGSPAVHDMFEKEDSEYLEHEGEKNNKSSLGGKRGTMDRWQPWQDRCLAVQTLAEDPYRCSRGQTGKIWESIAINLSALASFPHRSGAACKQRLETLIKRYKAETLADLQSSGEESEISEFMDHMEEICEFFDMQSTNAAVKGAAKRKAEKASEEGIKAREDALKGMVTKDKEEDGTDNGKQRKRRKAKSKEESFSLDKLEHLEEEEIKWQEYAKKQEERDEEWKEEMLDHMKESDKTQKTTNDLLGAMLTEMKASHKE